MLEHVPTIGARFDLKKIGTEQNCWQVFWRAVRPLDIAGASLYEGSIHHDDYCIAVQSSDPEVADVVKCELSASKEFLDVCCVHPFIEGENCIAIGLPRTGRVDSSGNLIGDDKRMSEQVTSPVAGPEEPLSMDVLESASPIRKRPASERTANLPNADSLEDIVATMKDRFVCHQPGFDRDLWISPQELCDVVEWYAPIIDLGLSFHKTEFSDSVLRVRMFDKMHPDEEPFILEGFYMFKSRYAVTAYLQQFISTPQYSNALPDLAGIVGRFHLHFCDPRQPGKSDDYTGEERIGAEALWPQLFAIRESFSEELARALDVLVRRRMMDAAETPKAAVLLQEIPMAEPEPEPVLVGGGEVSEERKLAREQERRRLQEENDRRRAEIEMELAVQEKRKQESRCIYCGKPLGFSEKLKKLDRHKDCWEYVPE